MREVELTGTGIVTTALGFGLGQLLRVGSAAARRRLLEDAHAAGIRHFDVARSYGLGLAEGELGRFARGKRDQLVIATKFGIEPSPAARRLGPLQGAARRVLAAFPPLRQLARRAGAAAVAARRYDSATARANLETSLRELATDYVDLFLLHEPSLEALQGSDVLDFLEDARRRGMIRAWGVSGPVDDATAICRERPALAPVVQVPSDVLTRGLEHLPREEARAFVSFSPFSTALPVITGHVGRDAERRRRWHEQVGVDCASADALAPLLLAHALEANRDGVVLFSSQRTERVRSLAALAGEPFARSSSIAALLDRVERELAQVRA